MKDFKNDSDTTLARFGRDKRARISSAERIERRPRLQRDAADSEHSSDSRPRASYNPNFTSDNRPVREDRAHRDDSRRSGNRSFGSDDRRRDDAADREFKPRFRSGKTGTLPAGTRITNRAVSRSSANLTVSRRRGATGHSAIGNPAVIAVRTNLTANVGTTTANRTVTRHSISLTVNAVPTIGNPVGSGAATARSAAGTISPEVIPDTIPITRRERYA